MQTSRREKPCPLFQEVKLRFVFPHCSHHGQLLLQQFLAEVIQREEIITCYIVPLKTLCHIQDHPLAMIIFWHSTGRFTCIDLHVPCIAASGPGLYMNGNCSIHLSQTSLMGASLSFTCQATLVPLLSKRITLDNSGHSCLVGPGVILMMFSIGVLHWVP